MDDAKPPRQQPQEPQKLEETTPFIPNSVPRPAPNPNANDNPFIKQAKD